MATSKSRESNVLARSIQSAYLNIFAMVAIRVFSFVANAVIFRLVSAEEVGISVRCNLLADTVFFVSREFFRKACLKKPASGDWRGTINLVWLGVPVGAVCSTALGYAWIHWLDPVPEHLREQYASYVVMACISCVLLLSTEVFYIVGQAYLHVAFRVFVDSYTYIQLQALTIAFVFLDVRRVVFFSGVAMLVNAVVIVAVNVVYFYRVVRRDRKKNDDEEDIPFESISEFLPDITGYRIDLDRFWLSVSFFSQGFLKQLLTEGEKYMITWFSLMSLGEQGVYDIICNLGSIPARLLFSKLEDSGHLYFSQTVTRGDRGDKIVEEEGPSRHLQNILRGLVHFCLVVITFGMSYSGLLLYIYGGEMLSTPLSVNLLRCHCFYVLFCAVNGITESYAFNAMTTEEVASYNGLMTAMTGVFLGCVWFFGRWFGPVGFTLANICNLTMRIAHNLVLISKRHRQARVKPATGLLPKLSILAALLASGCVCALSEQYVYVRGSLKHSIVHLIVGGICFLLSSTTIVMKTPEIRDYARRKLKSE